MVRDIYYIVYVPGSLKIVATSHSFDRGVHKLLQQGYKFINVTHPASQNILKDINKVNNTDYK
jgi:hypothetical protein